jgi:hypothetical protein
LSQTVGTNSLILILYKKGDQKIYHFYIDEIDENKVKETLRTKSFLKKVTRNYKEVYNQVWSFTEYPISAIKSKISNLEGTVIQFDNIEYFDVRGGFQPPITTSELYEINEEEYKKLTNEEQKLVFNLIYDAKEIKRYNVLTKTKKFWIVSNDVESEEILKKTILTYMKSCQTELRPNTDSGGTFRI